MLPFKVKTFPKYVEVVRFYRVVLRSHETYSQNSAHVFSGRPCWTFLYYDTELASNCNRLKMHSPKTENGAWEKECRMKFQLYA